MYDNPAVQEPSMFIKVLYGDNEEALFNPNCRTLLLLEHIKEKVGYQPEIDIDLSDENGFIVHLLRSPPLQYASDVLESRRTFILVKVSKRLTSSNYDSRGQVMDVGDKRLNRQKSKKSGKRR
ncbi:hypothetical protein ACHWQZ_G008042 [Mnemiopsis leidyi]